VSAVDAGPAWSAWSRVTPVAVAPAAPRRRYVRVALPLAVAPGPLGTFADLRVIDERGNEVPYALDPARPASATRRVALIDTGFVPHRGTQAVLDLGPSGALVDAITLDVDTARRATYFERVGVDASDDRRTWRIVRTDAIVYRVPEASSEDATLNVPPTRSRWLRVRVLDPNTVFPIVGAHVAAAGTPEPPLTSIPAVGPLTIDAAAHEQSWTLDAGTPVRPAAVAFADGGALYARSVTVEASDDGTTWTGIGEGSISHYAEGGAERTVGLRETTARYVRVTVHNGNDAPVTSLQPSLLARPHAVVFERKDGSYRLLSGNPAADAPSYDLRDRLAHERWRAADAQAGATAGNAGYRDPRPIGERFPWLLTGALIAAALVLGGLALRIVRRPETA
jgi:hypothetical protein